MAHRSQVHGSRSQTAIRFNHQSVDKMKAIAYIDAFNFYYGLTKNTKYRWCDLYSLCKALTPLKYELDFVRVFTGCSKALTDPGQPERQSAYLRALETCGNVYIEKSNFSIREKEYYLSDGSQKVNVKVPQEKGADVNLATFLLIDAYHNRFDLAMILSNDSDLENPIRMVRKEFNKQTRIFSPIKSTSQQMSDKLIRASGQANHEIIPFDLVKKHQLPDIINRKGKKDILKPREWY